MNRRSVLIGAGATVVVGAGATALTLNDMGSMATYRAAVAASRVGLAARPDARELIRFATLAANSHNTQPWRFRVESNDIAILPDFTRRTPAVDPDDHHLFTSLGCAAENLVLAAGTETIRFEPAQGGSIICATSNRGGPRSSLVNAIVHRQSTRSIYDGRAVGVAELNVLAASVAAIPGVDLVLVTDQAQMGRVRDLVMEGNSAQIADAAFMRELSHWIRFNPRDALATGDGLFSATSGSPALPGWLGPRLLNWVFRANTENEKCAAQIASSAGIAVFSAHRSDQSGWVQVGRACQRFALQATALGLKHAFLNQPVEVAHLRPELAALIGLPGRRPDIVMRFGRGVMMPYSARRPVNAVVVASTN